MKIQGLSIIGFKSFMDKLAINFSAGISGIVGPNGCGKSNIVDAIRWCLGEQSPKQLRGRQMEDVIFGGAGGYKPLGMAEVSLLFENEREPIQGPFSQSSEISVTRRLYRSGESEYRINNSPCRLKDIQELFMDTGLGNRAYSIIGQGKIGAILEQRPEETRIMLEEAAGITKYRKKVEISQRKMAQTEANLQRVEDILGEIERQMRSLKRQAAKARRYKALSEEIRELELVLSANAYHQLMETSGARKKSTEVLLQKELEKATGLSNYEARLESLGLDLDQKDGTLSELRSTHERLLERVHRKESRIESLAGEIKMQEELEHRLIAEREHMDDRLLHLREEQDGLDARIKGMEADFERHEGDISLIQQRGESRRQTLEKIREEYEKAKTILGKDLSRETGLNRESQILSKMLSGMTDGRSRLEQEQEEVTARIEKTLQASRRKTAEREALHDRLQELNEAVEEKTMACQELEQDKITLQSDLQSAEKELSVCQTRLSSLETLTSNFEGFKQGVRTIMKAKDLDLSRRGRIMGLVADVLQVDSRYETAVEAVLADQLQYVIVETQGDGKLAVDYLKGKAKGRSSFIPLKELNGNGNGHSHDNNSYPLLRDLIDVPEGYRPLLDALLSDAMVVDTLDEALSAWRGNGRNKCLVTLEGDMVDQRGIISGGKQAHAGVGILSRKRELVELRLREKHFEVTAAGLQKKLARMNEKVQQERQSLEDQKEERWSCQDEINELDKTIFQLGQELDNLERLSERIARELTAKDTEEKKQKERLSEIEEAILQCKARRAEKEEWIRQKQVELKEYEKDYEAVREELSRLKTDYRILQEERKGLLREKERLLQYAEEAGERIEQIKADITNGRQTCEAAQRKKESLQQERLILSGELKKSQESLNLAERERQDVQAHMRKVEQDARNVREEIGDLREKITQARMEESEIRFKMDGLAKQVQERFNLDLPEIYGQYLVDDFSAADRERELNKKRELRGRLGEVNLTAIKEHEALKDRSEFIQKQKEDLLASIDTLRKTIRKINRTSLEKFGETFQKVDEKLKEIFPILFNGGTASLTLTDEEHPLESGVLVEVRPPGKKLSHMGLLSGGEKALVAMALLFAIYMIKPSPFCLLDEVDAPLDEANIDRFNTLLQQIRQYSQIIMVTHNRRTMEIADRLYGITMEKKGVSKIVSVNLNGKKAEDTRVPMESLEGPKEMRDRMVLQ
jgi:chromosome segregation protein